MQITNLMGEAGGKWATDGESGTAGSAYICIMIHSDTVFSVLTQANFDANSSGGALTAKLAKTYTAGTIIYGQITAFTVTTGLVQAFESDYVN